MARAAAFITVLCVLGLAATAEAQESDSARAAALPIGTVLRITLPAQSGPLFAIGAVTQLRNEGGCLHVALAPESETTGFGVRVADQLVVERQLGTPRPDGTVPADPRWVAVPSTALEAAGIACITGD
jgi:hypothetical protein